LFSAGGLAVRIRLRSATAALVPPWLMASLLIALVMAPHSAASQTQVQINQTFVPQGPAPEFGNYEWIASADAKPNGTDAGAVQSVLVDTALGAGTMFAASPNGGIWVTANNGTTWKPLTDNQASLSISSLSLDPTDTSGKTIIAGIGLVDSGLYSSTANKGAGGPRDGLLYTTDGGANWSALGTSAFGGETVVSAVARGNTLLAATFEMRTPTAPTTGYGLFRSTDGGATFTNVAGASGSGLPAGAVTSLVGDPNNPNTFYAAVKNRTDSGATAVYISRDAGATWTPAFTAAMSGGLISSTGDQTVITLAAGPNGSVAIAVTDLGHPRQNGQQSQSAALTGVFLSSNQGSSWNQLNGAPNVIPGAEGPLKVHLAIDPGNQNVVYLTGDAYQTCPCSAVAYRLTYNPATNSTTPASLTFEGTGSTQQNASTFHADTRSLTFDQAGNLIVSSDGGIYVRTNPAGNGTWEGGTGTWLGLNGNLSVFEGYSVAYDANSKRVAIAAQDNGVALQHATGSAQFDTINGGDGTNVAINDRTLSAKQESAIYSVEANLSFIYRLIVNALGQALPPGNDPVNSPGGVPVTCSLGTQLKQDCGTLVGAANAFSAQFVLNTIDPTQIALTGGTHAYVTQDTLSGAQGVHKTSIDLTLTDLGPTHGVPNAVSYGTMDNQSAIAVGSGGDMGSIWLSTTGAAGSLVEVASNLGALPTGVVFDTRAQSQIYAADGTSLFSVASATTTPALTTVTAYGTNLPGFITPTSVQFISNNGVNALLVGGMNVPLSCTSVPNGCVVSAAQSPIIAADSAVVGSLTGWRYFGQGLPNTLVFAMAYNPTVDVLAVSSIGRGAYLLYDVTSYFPQAQQLWFGLANNDSMPDASYLTNGTVGVRPLIKYGTGTLTIAGDASYTGGTLINGGALVLGNGGASGSVIGNIAFCTNAADPACDATTDKVLAFNRSDVFSYGGSITGAGQVVQAGTGTTILTGNSTYTGPTAINAGTLMVNGAITSQVAVNAGGALAGTGTVADTTVNAGAVLAPGSPTGTLTVQGNLVLASASAYLVQISAAGVGRTFVTGTASLGGTVGVVSDVLSRHYDILTAAGGLSGQFAGAVVAGSGPALTSNLNYGASDVFLDLSLNYAALGSLNANQQRVGNAVSNVFNGGGSIPTAFTGLTPVGLSQIAGETATGSQQTTFQAMTQFLNTLLDPFIDGRGAAASQAGGTPYAADGADAAAYAVHPNRQGKSSSEREAYAAMSRKAPPNVYDPRWSVWAAGFGGSQTTDGNAVLGSNSMTSSIFGTAVGADYLLSPRTLVGFAAAGGGTSFSVDNFGTGRSDLFQAGVFVKHRAGPAYLSAALAYGWQNVTTDRTVTAAGFDQLHANFNANTISGRVEGGYRVVAPWLTGVGIAPYAAGQFTTFMLPSYAEQAVIGANTFALAYGAQNVTDVRSELGVRTDKPFAVSNGVLTLRSRLAWAHDFDPSRSVSATFQTVPGASFVTGGAAQASESALTTLAAEMHWLNGWSASATFEGEFSKVIASYAGKGVVRYQW
jgi:autotransporter-associated beta strand protein